MEGSFFSPLVKNEANSVGYLAHTVTPYQIMYPKRELELQ